MKKITEYEQIKLLKCLKSMVESYDILLSVVEKNKTLTGVIKGAFIYTANDAKQLLKDIEDAS